jgi:cell division protein FtsA
MSNGQLMVACDFGTSNFRTLVSRVGVDGRVEVLGAACVAAAGFRDGDFVDLQAGSHAIARAVVAAEAEADVDIAAFFYNIAGSHLRSFSARGQIQLGPVPRAITAVDMDAALNRARTLEIPFDQCILAANPVDWAVDRVRGIVDPRGRLGSQLQVEAHLVTASGTVVRNVEHAIKTAGYEVAGRAVDSLATAEALLQAPEREEGVLLVDVGGRSTQWALFRGGRLAGNGAVPWGGAHLTADLAHGLRIGLQEAEQVKRQCGVVLRSLVDEADPLALFEDERPTPSPGLLAAILEPRLEEIFALVKNDLRDPGLLSGLGRGVVLTGGGSRCRGAAALCEEVFGLPAVCRYLPPGMAGNERLGDGQWATALGLTLWAMRGEPQPRAAVASAGGGENSVPLWHRMRGRLGRTLRPGGGGSGA